MRRRKLILGFTLWVVIASLAATTFALRDRGTRLRHAEFLETGRQIKGFLLDCCQAIERARAGDSALLAELRSGLPLWPARYRPVQRAAGEVTLIAVEGESGNDVAVPPIEEWVSLERTSCKIVRARRSRCATSRAREVVNGRIEKTEGGGTTDLG